VVSVAAHVRPARNMQAACTPDRRLAADSGIVSAYLHAGPAPALGRMGALLALEASGAVQDALSCPKPKRTSTALTYTRHPERRKRAPGFVYSCYGFECACRCTF